MVPCYNEAQRLDADAMLSLLEGQPRVSLIFVDDGSKDETAALLRALADRKPDAIDVVILQQNRGKAEAVRAGLRVALGLSPDHPPRAAVDWVGYVDADLATPPEEIKRLCAIALSGDAEVVMAARISLLGNHIERSHTRHYLGRVFASAASVLLETRVYDTQCGAKLFRRSPGLEAALAQPFLSRWAFDVELLGRLLAGTADAPPVAVDKFIEVPLHRWREVGGSKLGSRAMIGVLKDLVLIGFDLATRRRAARKF